MKSTTRTTIKLITGDMIDAIREDDPRIVEWKRRLQEIRDRFRRREMGKPATNEQRCSVRDSEAVRCDKGELKPRTEKLPSTFPLNRPEMEQALAKYGIGFIWTPPSASVRSINQTAGDV